jgi:HemX protein
MTDRTFLWLALVFYAISGALTLLRMRKSGPSPSPLNYATMLGGFALHTTFLYLRGQTVHRCPLTNSFEATVFIAWAAVLFYLLIGPSYRVSFLGAFTAPFVFSICLVALLGLNDTPRPEPLARSPWIDFHAAIAILACGAFALAFVAGALPPIEQLEVINYRLIVLGFVMLTAGMIGGVVSYHVVGHWTKPKIVWAVVAWLVYATLLAARWLWSLRGRKIAVISMVSFAFVLFTFWGVNLLR